MVRGAVLTGDYGGSPARKYWMYLAISEYFENVRPLDDFVQILINFGETLEDKAKVTLPLRGAYSRTRRSILRLSWDHDTWEDLDRTKDPYLLVLPKPLSSFKPAEDQFIIMRFSEAISRPTQYVEVLDKIASEIKSGRDIFEWKNRPRKDKGFPQRLLEAIEAKPGAFGFSIDLKKLLTG